MFASPHDLSSLMLSSLDAPALRVARQGEVLDVATHHEPRFASAFRVAFDMSATAYTQQLDVEAVYRVFAKVALHLLPILYARLLSAASRTVDLPTLRTAKGPSTRAPKKINVDVSFSVVDSEVTRWALRHSGRMVTQVSATTRKRIGEIIAEQLAPREAQKAIVKMLKDPSRAKLIAKHETVTAANQGQRMAWARAQERGLISAKQKRRWIITPDDKLCPICQGLEGKTATLDGEFTPGIAGAPAHIGCRCTEGLA